MSRYRKKPVEVEAWQFRDVGFAMETLPDWLRRAFTAGVVIHRGNYLEIKTLEGSMRCELGSWVIRGITGEMYPCRNDIFRMTYEEVQDAVQE